MSKWSEKYREKLKGINKNPQDYEEEELLQQEKWCALTEILDEYEEKIEQLEKQIEKMKNCHNCKGFSEYRCSECKNYDKWEAKE